MLFRVEDAGSELEPALPVYARQELPFGFAPLNFRYFLSGRPEQRFLVPGLLPLGHRVLATAGAGVGKSMFTTALAVHVAAGRDFLGRKLSGEHRVLYLDGENGAYYAWNRIKAMSGGNPPPTLHYVPMDPCDLLSRDNYGYYYVEHIEKYKPHLVVIDTVSSLTDTNDLDGAGVRSAIAKLSRPVLGVGGTIVMLHHNRKSSSGRTEDVLGSVAWGASVDINWQLMKKAADPEDAGPSFVLREAKNRNAPEADDLLVRFRADGDYATVTADPIKKTAAPKAAPKARQRDLIRSRLLDGLSRHRNVSWGELVTDLADAGAPRTIRNVLNELVAEGAVQLVRPGVFAVSTG